MSTTTPTKELTGYCRENLPEYMLPEQIEYLPDLPRTERGKVDYRALEQQAANQSKE